MKTLHLRVLNTDLKGTELTLNPPGGILGRARDNALCIRYSGLSSRHARFEWDPARGWMMADAGSTNGTLLNGQLVSDQPRALGTQARVACADLELEVWSEAPLERKPVEAAPETMVYGVSLLQSAAKGNEFRPSTLVNLARELLVEEEEPLPQPLSVAERGAGKAKKEDYRAEGDPISYLPSPQRRGAGGEVEPPPRVDTAPETMVQQVSLLRSPAPVTETIEPQRPVPPTVPEVLTHSAPPDALALRALVRESVALADSLGTALESLAQALSAGADRSILEQKLDIASLRLADLRSRLGEGMGGHR